MSGTDRYTLVQAAQLSGVAPDATMPPEVDYGLLGKNLGQANIGFSGTLSAQRPVLDLISASGADEVAQQMTVAAGLVQPIGPLADGSDANNVPAVLGRLWWGVEGYQAAAEFDFALGTQVTVAGSFVRLQAALDLDAPGNGDPVAGVIVGAHLGYGTPATRRAQRTRYFALGANPAAVTLPIPPFAEQLTAVRAGGGGGLVVELLDRAGTVVAAANTAGPLELSIPNDARLARVTNLEAVATVGRLVFGLWL